MESLKEYADLFERLKLTELTGEEGDRRITLRKTPAPVSAPVCAPVLPVGVAPAPGTVVPAQNAGLPGGVIAGGNGASETAGAAGTASPAPVRKGEIVGLQGLMGAGRTECALTVFGNPYGYKIKSGEVIMNGKSRMFKSPREAIKNGLAYVSEDRKGNGLVLIQDIRYKTTLAKSGSDYREGRNIAALISRSMF